MENKRNNATSQMSDTDRYMHKLSVSNPLREPTLRKIIRALQLPLGSRGLDAGCGIGFQAMLLAEAVGINGHVTGLDVSPKFLNYARKMVKKSGLSERVSFQEGNVSSLPFENNTFDWVWSADCVGYAPGEPLPLLKELARVVEPGGSVIILFWSSQKLLPGYPLLEARLNVTSAGIAPFRKGMRSELHSLRLLGWFRKAGLEESTVQTFVGDVYAPLSNEIRAALIDLFEMRWGTAESEVTQEDWEKYQHLCRPESSDCILNLPDYYAFFTYSMFCGKVVK
jgi:ubiquinone/menaquinone biosynthesis C-methylase UbiE